jgi:hypothetical protein
MLKTPQGVSFSERLYELASVLNDIAGHKIHDFSASASQFIVFLKTPW